MMENSDVVMKQSVCLSCGNVMEKKIARTALTNVSLPAVSLGFFGYDIR